MEKFHWKKMQNQIDGPSSEDPQRSVKVFSDHAVQITSNKTLIVERGRDLSWTITSASPISSHMISAKLPGPQSSQMSQKEGKLHTSCHASIALPFITVLQCNRALLFLKTFLVAFIL